MFLRGFVDSHPWGTPEQTIARATELAEAFGTNEIMFVFKYGSMPIDAAQRSMRLFAAEVMPALKALDPSPIEAGDDDGPLVPRPGRDASRRRLPIRQPEDVGRQRLLGLGAPLARPGRRSRPASPAAAWP